MNFVWMQHPSNPDGEPTKQPVEAFEGYWKGRGWVQVEVPPKRAVVESADETVVPEKPKTSKSKRNRRKDEETPVETDDPVEGVSEDPDSSDEPDGEAVSSVDEGTTTQEE